jgi:hypothetical protein
LIRDAGALYLSLVAADKWLEKTSDTETVLASLVAKVDCLVLQTDGGWGRGCGRRHGRGCGHGRGGRGWNAQNIPAQTAATCWTCGKKGHISPNCPNKAKLVAEDDWKKLPPKKGESPEKVVDGKLWKWCGCCSQWTLSHSTAEHKDAATIKPATNLTSVDGGSVSCLMMMIMYKRKDAVPRKCCIHDDCCPMEKYPAMLGILTVIMLLMTFVQLVYSGLYYPCAHAANMWVERKMKLKAKQFALPEIRKPPDLLCELDTDLLYL